MMMVFTRAELSGSLLEWELEDDEWDDEDGLYEEDERDEDERLEEDRLDDELLDDEELDDEELDGEDRYPDRPPMLPPPRSADASCSASSHRMQRNADNSASLRMPSPVHRWCPCRVWTQASPAVKGPCPPFDPWNMDASVGGAVW